MITAFISCLAPFQPSVIQDLTIGSTNHLRPPTSFLCLEYCSWHCCSSLSCCCCGEEGGLFSDFSPDCPIRPCCLLLFVQWLLRTGEERSPASLVHSGGSVECCFWLCVSCAPPRPISCYDFHAVSLVNHL